MKKDGEVEFTLEELKARSKPRPGKQVEVRMPLDAWESLEKAAAHRDMSPEALMRLYIGQGLRQDLSQMFGNHVLERTAEILAKRLKSAEEVTAIMREIRLDIAA